MLPLITNIHRWSWPLWFLAQRSLWFSYSLRYTGHQWRHFLAISISITFQISCSLTGFLTFIPSDVCFEMSVFKLISKTLPRKFKQIRKSESKHPPEASTTFTQPWRPGTPAVRGPTCSENHSRNQRRKIAWMVCYLQYTHQSEWTLVEGENGGWATVLTSIPPAATTGGYRVDRKLLLAFVLCSTHHQRLNPNWSSFNQGGT